MEPVVSADNNFHGNVRTNEPPLSVSQLRNRLEHIDLLMNRMVLHLVSTHHGIRDKLMEAIRERKMYNQSIDRLVTELQELEKTQAEELVSMLDEQKLERQQEIHKITLEKFKGIIDEIGPF